MQHMHLFYVISVVMECVHTPIWAAIQSSEAHPGPRERVGIGWLAVQADHLFQLFVEEASRHWPGGCKGRGGRVGGYRFPRLSPTFPLSPPFSLWNVVGNFITGSVGDFGCRVVQSHTRRPSHGIHTFCPHPAVISAIRSPVQCAPREYRIVPFIAN